MTINANDHIFKRFDNEMQSLHKLVTQMGSLAISQLREAVATLDQQGVEKAHQIIENDKKINALDIQADDEIVRIIALRQPMAKDLREIIAVSKIIAELERAGDEARKIAKLTIRFYAEEGITPNDEILQDIYALAVYVEGMLTNAMQVFDHPDLLGAIAVLEQEQQLDQKLQNVYRRLHAFVRKDLNNTEHFIDFVLGIRALERFGGHAKNIAGHILFIQYGTDVRHDTVENILQHLKGQQSSSNFT